MSWLAVGTAAGRCYGAPTFTPLANGQMCDDIEAMQELMNVNFFGQLRVLKAALPLLPKQGTQRTAHNACFPEVV